MTEPKSSESSLPPLDLPPPTPRSQLDTSFRRLLDRCYASSQSSPKSFQNDPKSHSHLHVLRDLLLQLETSPPPTLEKSTLQAYRTAVQALQQTLTPYTPPAFLNPPKPPPAAASPRAPSKPVHVAGGTHDSLGEEAPTPTTPATAAQFQLTPANISSIAREEAAQDSLVEEMVPLAQQLKADAARMGSELRKRANLVDDVGGQLEDNVKGVKQANRKTNALKSRMFGSMFTNMVIYAVVGVTGVAMFTYIQATSYAKWVLPTWPRKKVKVGGASKGSGGGAGGGEGAAVEL